MTKNRVIIVIGPGRSGTSALTRGLAALGVELGDHLKPATPKNARGYFEDLDILDLNHRLHQAFGLKTNGSSLRLIEDREWQAVDLRLFKQELAAIVTKRFDRCPLWGFKSGGVMRLLSFWEEALSALDLDIGYVLAIRNPLSVAQSRAKLDAIRGAQENSDLEWLTRVVPYFRLVMNRRFAVVDYDDLMRDAGAQLKRIARALDIAVTAAVEDGIKRYAGEFLEPNLRHNRSDLAALETDARINPLTRSAYQWLYRLAQDEIGANDPQFRTEWQRIEDSLRQMAPVLRHLDFLDGKIRGPRWGVGGAWHTIVQYLPLPLRTAR